MDSLDKIRTKPEETRRFIMWAILAIVILGLGFLVFKRAEKRMRDFSLEQFKEKVGSPSFEETETKIEVPDQELESLKDALEQITTSTTSTEENSDQQPEDSNQFPVSSDQENI